MRTPKNLRRVFALFILFVFIGFSPVIGVCDLESSATTNHAGGSYPNTILVLSTLGIHNTSLVKYPQSITWEHSGPNYVEMKIEGQSGATSTNFTVWNGATAVATGTVYSTSDGQSMEFEFNTDWDYSGTGAKEFSLTYGTNVILTKYSWNYPYGGAAGFDPAAIYWSDRGLQAYVPDGDWSITYCDEDGYLTLGLDISPDSPTSTDVIYFNQTSSIAGYHFAWLTYFVSGQVWPDSYHYYGWNHTSTSSISWSPLTLPQGDYQFYSGFSADDDETIDGFIFTNFTVVAPGAPLAVNLLEKYSNAALINQAVSVTPVSGGSGETKTSLYGETLHFDVLPYQSYWINASRPGYQDYNETYTIPASPGIYNVYMERTLTPIEGKSYAHFSVVDQTNGGLIPNAEIRLSDGQTKLTNSAGYTWFSVNNSEQINYYVSKPSGYWPAYGAMNLTADESILVALQRYTGPTATATMPGWTPVTVPTTGTGVDPVVTLSAQLRQQNVQEGMDVWYTNLPFISQFLFLLFIIGGLGLMAGGTRRN